MSLAEATNFVEQGSLAKPLIIGRLVRAMLGGLSLYGVYQLTVAWPFILENGLPADNPSVWAAAALAFWLMPPVINIGFSLNTRRLSRWIIVGVSLALGAYHYFSAGAVLGYALGVFTTAWIYYLFVHLGFSLVLAALLATPGCEMRSIPHLWTLVTGRATKEHYCPGFFDRLDRWERQRQAT
ncbi:MAG: hypothetical protein IH996_04705 [Proteobacteria bacterium]|nr:hypothetical protein [Pseudomonadota bacterium]